VPLGLGAVAAAVIAAGPGAVPGAPPPPPEARPVAPAPTFGLPPAAAQVPAPAPPSGRGLWIGIVIGTLASAVLFVLAYVLFLSR
jgi:hypothetical protein